ncbi:hypothetical protein [Asticcacaulis solisilvae]|uniref:hypothetical protein n=1 Tax=Asticcacaulis solisilvae TaxID=1217274 RepID=UPI003FD762D9
MPTDSRLHPVFMEPAAGPPSWRLVLRDHLNPAGGERLFRVGLASTRPGAIVWRAGDIAELELPNGQPRSYSISSMPSEGRLDLLVREMKTPDGTLGQGAAWLLHALQPGHDISLRIRSHEPFRAPASEGPVLLIGAGSGLAGLRPHILEAAEGRRPVWLIYGERHSDGDNRLCRELNAWHRDGTLYRFNLALSRTEPGQGTYVQDIVARYAGDLKAFLGGTGTVMTCGSRAMGEAVERALGAVLGPEWIGAAFEDGRYRQALF